MWGFLLTILFVGSFFYLFVCVDPHSGGILAAGRNFFLGTLPDSLKRFGRRYISNRLVDAIEAMV